MSLFSSSSSTRSQGGSSSGADPTIEGGFIDFAKLINSLGTKNPKDYFGGASRLQNAAYSMGAGMANRWGANYGEMGGQSKNPSTERMGFGTVKLGDGMYGQGGHGETPYAVRGSSPLSAVGEGSGGGAGGQSLYGAAGIKTPEGTIDWSEYVKQNKDLNTAYLALTPANMAHISRSHGDGSGNVTRDMFGKFHYDSYGQGEQRIIPRIGGGGPNGEPSPFNQNFAQYGYADANDPYNPVADWQHASRVARGMAYGGPNLAAMADLGPANTYDATGYRAATIGDDQRVDMGSAAGGSARRGIEFSKDYENQYTDNVVDSTLANFDEYAGRQRAAEAAKAAGNNAFGGSRFAVQRATTEEQIARERQAAESGMRFEAQDRAFGHGMQDAQRFTDTSIANAQMANSRAEAQAGLDMDRLLANMNANNMAGAFSADAMNDAGQFNASSQSQFDLTEFGAANDMARFNADQADDADGRRLDAANSLSNIANTASANQRQDLHMINALGVDQRNIEQQQRTADLELMRIMQQMYGGMPWFTNHRDNSTVNTTETPSAASVLGSVATAASGLPFGAIGSALGIGGATAGAAGAAGATNLHALPN